MRADDGWPGGCTAATMTTISKAFYDVRFFVIGFAATGLFFTSVYRSGLANRTPGRLVEQRPPVLWLTLGARSLVTPASLCARGRAAEVRKKSKYLNPHHGHGEEEHH